jgi:hypothetical protein
MHSCVGEDSRSCTSKALGSFDVILCRRCLVYWSCIFFTYAGCLFCCYEAFTNTTAHVSFCWVGLIVAACFLHFTVIWDTFSILDPASDSLAVGLTIFIWDQNWVIEVVSIHSVYVGFFQWYVKGLWLVRSFIDVSFHMVLHRFWCSKFWHCVF